MRRLPSSYLPVTMPIVLVLFLLAVFVIALVEVGVLEYAYEQLGIGHRFFGALLLLSLLGSVVNVPVTEIPATNMASPGTTSHLGVPYPIPEPPAPGRTVIAVNVGGALIPAALSLYLVVTHGLYLRASLAIAAVAAASYFLARPVRGLGIAMPVFVPPVIAALVAFLLAPRAPAVLAYAGGSLGTLVGADLLNLRRIRDLGAPIVSIGGAGTFDGVFLTGILAVLLA